MMESVVEPRLGGKLFHQGVEAQHTAATYPSHGLQFTRPNITLFFLWWCLKDQVYSTPLHDLADLQGRIYATVNNVTPQILQNTWVEVEYQLYISRATNGSHVEVYGT